VKNILNKATAFDSFNARNISPELVASTFIPPIQFDDLCKRTHNLLVGPRGSGKTTLMKMLHPAAINAWDHEKAENLRMTLDYSAVFIPSDVMWGAQVNMLGNGKLDKRLTDLLGIAAFTTNVVEGLINTIEYRIKSSSNFLGVKFSKKQEAFFVSEFSGVLKLDIAFNSLLALKIALKTRRNSIFEIASKASFMEPEKHYSYISSYDFLHIHFISILEFGIELFDGLIEENEARWALMFDELEIAPDAILENLLVSIRSVNQKLIFKLSLSPYHKEVEHLNRALSAMPGQDYKTIQLWFASKMDSYSFSNALLKSLIDKKFGDGMSLEKVFGDSDFDIDDDEYLEDNPVQEKLLYGQEINVNVYKNGSRRHKRFKELYETDSSFMQYIDSNDINLDKIQDLPNQKRAQYIRKVAPLVQARLVFRKEIDDRASSRARKNPLIYTGAQSIMAITEGNPRWLIGLVTSLFNEIDAKGSIAKKLQANEIRKLSSRFRALIKTIPCRIPNDIGNRGLLSLLDKIGERFYKEIVIDDFKSSPAGSFTVDSNTSPDILNALGLALNAGAIIYVPDNSDVMVGSLRGKRFRLSYLLACQYKLPLVLLKSISLTRALGIDEKTASNSNENVQLDFGLENED
jgi:energy-coupling factor transporter ATP-binding protein EcfA2